IGTTALDARAVAEQGAWALVHALGQPVAAEPSIGAFAAIGKLLDPARFPDPPSPVASANQGKLLVGSRAGQRTGNTTVGAQGLHATRTFRARPTTTRSATTARCSTTTAGVVLGIRRGGRGLTTSGGQRARQERPRPHARHASTQIATHSLHR